MDRALMARLMVPAEASPQSPFFYLLDVYARASAELRSASSHKDKEVAQRLQDVACYAQELAVSHANLVLTMDLFPEVHLHNSLVRRYKACISRASSIRSCWVNCNLPKP